MRRVPIRMKLAVALAVPLLAMGVATVLEVLGSSDDAAEIREQTDLARAAIGPSGLITALQDERTWAAVELIGYDQNFMVPVAGYEETRAQVDGALEALRDRLDGLDVSVTGTLQPALDGLGELEGIRADIDANTVPHDLENLEFSQSIFDRYTAVIEPFFDAMTRIAVTVDDPELRQGAELADVTARHIEVFSDLVNTTINYATLTEGGINQPSEIVEIATLEEAFLRNAATMRTAGGPYAEIAERYFPSELTDTAAEQIDQAIATGQVNLEVLISALNVPREESYLPYQDAIYEQINDRADELNASAGSRQRVYSGLAAVTLVAAVVLTWLVSRSITKPLRTLTDQAKDMAERRLPDAVLDILETPLGHDVEVPRIEPVLVRTRDEVADVAEALNTVQESALDLAVEQAVLRRNIADSFVNLGRRNQNLLGRQLDFITELESNETDPDTLASLFRLDHLATRMRRNAESLLVLAGIDPPRKWAAPVRLTDVIRAALGEVEDYQRVTVRDVEPATILGSAAADLAHLIAEFVENALTFSPPSQTVEVRGRRDGESYTLAVVDGGFGMPESDIEAANRRLAGTESFTIAPSKYLGHYVAGNLAARHDIRLRLGPTPGGGITATVQLPPALLTSEAPSGDPITDPHGTKALVAARAADRASGDGNGASGEPALVGAEAGAPAPGDPSAPPASGPAEPSAPTGPARTPSGLVHRTPRATGQSPTVNLPSGDLLDTLRHHTGRTGAVDPGGPSGPAAPGHGAPGGPGGLAARGRSGDPGVPNGPGRPGGPGGLGAPGAPGAPAAPGGGPGDPSESGGPGAPGGPGGFGAPGGPAGFGAPGGPGGPGGFGAAGGPAGFGAPGGPGGFGAAGRAGGPDGFSAPGGSGAPGRTPGGPSGADGLSAPGGFGLPIGPGGAGGPGGFGAPPGPERPGGARGGPSGPPPAPSLPTARPALPARSPASPVPPATPAPPSSPLDLPGPTTRRGPESPAAPPTASAPPSVAPPAAHRPSAAGPAQPAGSPRNPPGGGGAGSTPGGAAPFAGLADLPTFAGRGDRTGPPSPRDRTRPPWDAPPPGGQAPGQPQARQPQTGPQPSRQPQPGVLPARQPQPGQPPSRQPQPGQPQPGQPQPGQLPVRRPPVSQPPAGPAPASPPPGSSAGSTPSGLTRRVKGAQMPSTQPLSLGRRADAGPGGEQAGRPPDRPADPASDVYGFLSNFTAGVQRGLDEARRKERD